MWLLTNDGGVGNGGMVSTAAMVMTMAMRGSLWMREVGDGCVIVPSGNREEEESYHSHAYRLACTVRTTKTQAYS